eukprot:363369-Chlamydomonas_euryale.AAC.5
MAPDSPAPSRCHSPKRVVVDLGTVVRNVGVKRAPGARIACKVLCPRVAQHRCVHVHGAFARDGPCAHLLAGVPPGDA